MTTTAPTPTHSDRHLLDEQLRAWLRMPLPLRIGLAVVTVSAFGAALLLLTQALGPENSATLSEWAFAGVPLAAGVVLLSAAWRIDEKGRWAWIMVGLGTISWGVGETIWEWYSLVRQVDPPYPGAADFFYLLGYPLIFVGVLLIPRARVPRWQRIRITLDMIAGSIALTGVLWVLYLSDVIYLDPEAGMLEQMVNLAYPLGDLYLLIGLLILAARKSAYRVDGRIIALGAAMLSTAVGDIIYALQANGDGYTSGGRTDALWLVAYGLIALTAILLERPGVRRAETDNSVGIRQMVVPYTAVVALVVLAMVTMGSPESALQGSNAAVAFLILARQAVALKETRQLVESQRDDLISSISHELRTPLTAMAGFAELLQDDPDMDREERMELIDIIAEQTGQVGRIAGDLVEVARDELVQTQLDLADLRIDTLVQSSIAAVVTHIEPDSITTNADDGLSVLGDLGRLRQVVVNFLTNADKYGGDRVHVVSRRADGRVIVEVHDDGNGVPEKYARRIWNQFDRGAHGRASTVQGSGLGLAIVRQLVVAHGGETGYRRSELLGGACFWMSLPSGGDGSDAAVRSNEPVGSAT